MVDNNETPGCDAPNISCFPVKWKTFAEYLEDAGVSWQVVCHRISCNIHQDSLTDLSSIKVFSFLFYSPVA